MYDLSIRQVDHLLSRHWDLDMVLKLEEFLSEHSLSLQDFLEWEKDNENEDLHQM